METPATSAAPVLDTTAIANLIAPLHAKSWQSAYRGIMPDHFLDFVVEGERLSHWRRRVAELREGSGEIFLARLNDDPVGFICIESNTVEETGYTGAYVNNLHVLPHLKRQGIGSALLRAGEEWARKHDYDRLFLFVFEDNLQAREFYRADGWHAVERLMSELPDGALAAELRLVKSLT
jgi:ribosomal protein S18 acetylase RimI-like enzyme